MKDDRVGDAAKAILVFLLKFIAVCAVGFAVLVFALFAIVRGHRDHQPARPTRASGSSRTA